MLFNPFPNKPWFLRVCSSRLLKTLWEKEKLPYTSNSSFSHSAFNLFGELFAIFIKLVLSKVFHFGIVENLSFGKGLTLFSTFFFNYIAAPIHAFLDFSFFLTSTANNILSKPLAVFPHNNF